MVVSSRIRCEISADARAPIAFVLVFFTSSWIKSENEGKPCARNAGTTVVNLHVSTWICALYRRQEGSYYIHSFGLQNALKMKNERFSLSPWFLCEEGLVSASLMSWFFFLTEGYLTLFKSVFLWPSFVLVICNISCFRWLTTCDGEKTDLGTKFTRSSGKMVRNSASVYFDQHLSK